MQYYRLNNTQYNGTQMQKTNSEPHPDSCDCGGKLRLIEVLNIIIITVFSSSTSTSKSTSTCIISGTSFQFINSLFLGYYSIL